MPDKPIEYQMTENDKELVSFITGHTDSWKEHRDTNYSDKWDEYERLYRGVWSDEDKTRKSERAKIVSPAIQQAVDSRIAELTEAVISRNEFFDIEDDFQDEDKTDIGFLRKKMKENFKKDKIRKALNDIMQLGEIFGTGIGEILVEKATEQRPEKQKMTPEFSAVGVRVSERIAVKLHPVHPRNFIPQPTVSDLDEMLGYAIEEEVPLDKVVSSMANGEYNLFSLQDCSTDTDIQPDGISIPYRENKVRIIRWYGKVPKEYLSKDRTEKEEPQDKLAAALEAMGNDKYEDYSDMVDAIVHIAEGSHLLKATKNPYMMGDRCCVAYRPQTLAGRFWGVGAVEKGYSMQKSLDGQLRSHLDSIGLTGTPMVGIDAARLPRGFKFTIQPGRTILTNGNPDEIIRPINLGAPTPVNIETAQLFERMLQQATGTIDSSGLPQQVNNQTDAGAMAMALSGIIKKHKIALLNFQEDFLIPFISRAAWRYMQYDPDNFPVKDWNFVPASTMGIMAREYEQQQFIALMQTLGPESPIVPLLLKGIIENSSLSNREELGAQLQQMSQPDPQQQQMEMQQQQLQMQLAQAQLQEMQAKAQKAQAEAALAMARAQAVPAEVQAKLAAALSNNLDEDNEGKDFERRSKITELMLKEKDLQLKEQDIASNERIASMQVASKGAEVKTKAVIEKMKLERDKEGNLTVTKSKE